MTVFGFSAFLKLAHLNERPRRTELRKRMRGGSDGGYDYHRSLRGLAKRLIVEGDDFSSVIVAADLIKKLPERNSAKSALAVLNDWMLRNAGPVFAVNRATIESPSGVYKVTYAPDFGVSLAGRRVSVHLWNTMRPELATRLVLPVLAQFYEPMVEHGVDEVAVLSLRDGRLFRLSDPRPYLDHAIILFEHIENLIEEIDDDGRRPPAEDRPVI